MLVWGYGHNGRIITAKCNMEHFQGKTKSIILEYHCKNIMRNTSSVREKVKYFGILPQKYNVEHLQEQTKSNISIMGFRLQKSGPGGVILFYVLS